MRLRSLVLSVVLGVVAVGGVWARQASPAQLALEAARKVEVVDRDLKNAAVRYRDVVSSYPRDRVVVPEALLGLASCLEQLGQPPEARAVYERVVKDYPDSAPARTAQKKLTAFGKQGSGFTIEEIEGDNSGAPSFEAGYMSFTDWDTGDLAVRDLKTGQARRVTAIPSTMAADSPAVYQSAPSPRGDQIAYVWGANPTELRIISNRGGQARVLHSVNFNSKLSSFNYVDLFGWSMNGKEILFASFGWIGNAQTTQIMTVSATGGAPRVLKTIAGSVHRASWSPDGRFIIYDAPRTPDKPEHALFIMGSDGSNATLLLPLVFPRVFNDQMLDWFPNGKAILFVSDRTGANAIFSQPITEGRAQGEPAPVKEDVGRSVTGQGFTQDGAYYYATLGVFQDILTFRLDASSGASNEDVRLSRLFNSGKSGAWSPDGSHVAYVQARVGALGRPPLLIQNVATGQVRTVTVDLAWLENPTWMPDGLAIIAEGMTAEGGHGLFRIDLAGGALTPVGDIATGATGRRSAPVVSADSREVLYLLGRKSVQARNLSSGAVRVVFESSFLIVTFALSPDGRFIAVGEISEDDAERLPPVRIVPVAGGQPRELGAEVPGNEGTGMAWSPDGRWVWFTRYQGPHMLPLWRVSVDGGNVQRMSTVSKTLPGIQRLSAAPDGTMAISGGSATREQWVMRNIPIPAGR